MYLQRFYRILLVDSQSTGFRTRDIKSKCLEGDFQFPSVKNQCWAVKCYMLQVIILVNLYLHYS